MLQGTLKGSPVAVKFINASMREEQLKREASQCFGAGCRAHCNNKVGLHRKAKHASIVEMIGLTRDPAGGGLVLVLELMEGGDVLSHLK